MNMSRTKGFSNPKSYRLFCFFSCKKGTSIRTLQRYYVKEIL
jgi:hypothetical protein